MRIKKRIAEWLGYGYSEHDLRMATNIGRMEAARTAEGIATNKMAAMFRKASGRSREVFEAKEMEFRMPIENFTNFQVELEKEIE